MIKIRILNSRRLDEAEIPYSTKLSEEIRSFVEDYINGKHDQKIKMFHVPLLSLLNKK